MGQLSGDGVALMRYSVRKRYVTSTVSSSGMQTVNLLSDDDGGDLEPGVCEE